MSPRLPRRRTERRGLRLWPVGIALALAFTAAVLVAAGVFSAGWGLLGARGLKPEHRVDSKTLFDLVKLSFGVVAGAGALVALVVAYRRQRVDEDGALRESTRLHTERFTTAVSQLGNESAAVRLGGVHALAGLADDAPTHALRQTCVDVLCAYLRLPYVAESDLPAGDAAARHTYLALREVRHTVIRLVRDHLRLPAEHEHSWQGQDLDFTGVVFDGGDFSGAVFSGGRASFGGATFSGGRVSFGGAMFSGGTVDFSGASFSGSTVDFSGSDFSGGAVLFSGAKFSGGRVSFGAAFFAGGRVDFRDARFSGGTVSFTGRSSAGAVGAVRFCGSSVDFADATFSDGRIEFNGAAFSGGTVDFGFSEFSGSEVGFVGARFSGSGVWFNEATFSAGRVKFAHTNFLGGAVQFDDAAFVGATVDFSYRCFSGGTVDFTDARGSAPTGLVRVSDPNGQLPEGLTVPTAWHHTTP
ncbi:pentapeptide repeat-containing protein [Streptomyces graminilatus]|uniref:pentapeptide repeat-containing protein n=1 Tax=Streptomyces graminilatus TaxID=1464070 RepID=UPI0006E380A8|nr:pentapeptide repeat-containing protein [Streptomyces graminilatus]